MILDVRAAQFSYSQDIPVFQDISFSLGEGDIFCILGPNGIGKSTLVRCLARLLTLSSGRIALEGKDIAGMSRKDIAKTVAFIPQIRSPAFSYSVFEFVLMGRSPYVGLLSTPYEQDISIAEDALSMVRITGLKEKKYTEISGGEQQLALFAQAIAQEPSLLLLDEPTSHLDLANQIHILEIIEDLAARGLTTVMTTHIPDHAILLGHRAAIMKDHTFFSEGSVDEVITDENMRHAYGIDVSILTMSETGQRTCVPVKRNFRFGNREMPASGPRF